MKAVYFLEYVKAPFDNGFSRCYELTMERCIVHCRAKTTLEGQILLTEKESYNLFCELEGVSWDLLQDELTGGVEGIGFQQISTPRGNQIECFFDFKPFLNDWGDEVYISLIKLKNGYNLLDEKLANYHDF